MELGVPSRTTSIFATAGSRSAASRPALMLAASLSAICRYPDKTTERQPGCRRQLERDQTGRTAGRQHKAELGKGGRARGRISVSNEIESRS